MYQKWAMLDTPTMTVDLRVHDLWRDYAPRRTQTMFRIEEPRCPLPEPPAFSLEARLDQALRLDPIDAMMAEIEDEDDVEPETAPSMHSATTSVHAGVVRVAGLELRPTTRAYPVVTMNAKAWAEYQARIDREARALAMARRIQAVQDRGRSIVRKVGRWLGAALTFSAGCAAAAAVGGML